MKEVREKQRKTPGTHLCLPHVHAKVFAPTHILTSSHHLLQLGLKLKILLPWPQEISTTDYMALTFFGGGDGF